MSCFLFLRRIAAVFALVVTIAVAPSAKAQVTNFWIGTDGADFLNSANWVDAFTLGGPSAVPTGNEIAFFSASSVGGALATNYVAIDSDVAFGRLMITTNGFAGSGNNPPAYRIGGLGSITLNGDGVGSLVGQEVITVNLQANALNPTISNNIFVGLAGGRINVNGGRTLTLAGNIGGTGAGVGSPLALTNTGTLRLTGSNLFTGGIKTWQGGTINVNAAAGLGIAPGVFTPGYISLWNGSTLTLNTNATTTGGGTDGGNFTVDPNMGITIGHANGGAATINVNNGTVTIAGDGQLNPFAVGTGNRLLKAGNGTLVLAGDQNLDRFRITAGVLQANNDTALGPVPGAPVVEYIQVTNVGGLALNFDGELNANRGIGIGFTNNNVPWTGGISILGATNTVSYAGTIANAVPTGGAGANHTAHFVKSGPGTLHLTGVNTYTGNTRIDAGYITETSTLPGGLAGASIVYNGGGLRVSNDFTITAPNLIIGSNNNSRAVFFVEDGATLTFNGGVVQNHTNAPGANNIISKNGPGTMILGGDLNHFGGVESSNGVLWLKGANTYTNLTQALGTGARIGIDSDSNLGNTSRLVLNNGGLLVTNDVTIPDTRVVQIGNNNGNNGGIFEVGDGATLTVNTVLFNQHSNNVSAGGITKLGAGTLVLNQTNIYGGTTTIREGTISVGVNEALGALSQGAIVDLGGGNFTNFSGKVSGVGTNFTISRGSLILNGTTQTVRDVNFADNNAASTANSTATISGGTLLMQGTINYTGGPTNLLGQRETGASVLSANVALLNNNKTITVNDSINTDSELTISGAIIGVADDLSSIGVRTITKAGLGTLVLSGPSGVNAFSNLTINAGTVRLGADEQLPDLRTVTVQGQALGGAAVAGTLDIAGRTETVGVLALGGGTVALVNDFASAMVIDSVGGGLLIISNNPTFVVGTATNHQGGAIISANLSLGAANRTFTIADSTNAAADVLITGILSSDNGNRTLTKSGLGTLVLQSPSGSNTSGSITIGSEGGIVQLGANEQIPDNRTLTISGTTNSTTQLSYFDLNGKTETIGALSMGNTNTFALSHVRESFLNDTAVTKGQLVVAGNITFNAGTAGTTFQSGMATITANLDLGAANRVANIPDSTNTPIEMHISGNISGTGRTLTVTNTGTLKLSGANTFSQLVVSNGATVINDGTFTGTITANAGGTIAGSGTSAGLSVLAGGVLAPGNSAGTMVVNGNLSLAAGAGVNFELDVANQAGGAGNNDFVDVFGNLTLDGTLNIDGGANFGMGTYILFEYTGTLTDNGLDIGLLTGNAASYAGNITLDLLTPGQVNVIVGVPEPSTFALAGIGAALLGMQVLRRRRNR